jgi:site-specific DNA-methyltransferase (adenine-specific)
MYEIHHVDCLDWMANQNSNSITAVVTDPPYALQEYEPDELVKKRCGKGGIWRIPPSYDGCQRAPLPRFSVINDDENARNSLVNFFQLWGKSVFRILVPGAHVIIATTPLLSDLLGYAMRLSGFERRGEIVRLVSTLRGGDRPKGAEKEFPEVSVLPRAGWEPWGIYRKPLSEKTVAQNLRRWNAGALRRLSLDSPFGDVIDVGRTSQVERSLAGHPSQKPMALMRILTRAVLPMETGIILDPFAGSGTTIAAAEVQELQAIGLERDTEFYRQAIEAIPRLVSSVAPILSTFYPQRFSSGAIYQQLISNE